MCYNEAIKRKKSGTQDKRTNRTGSMDTLQKAAGK